MKIITFEGTKVSNLNELFSIANGLHGDGWNDYYDYNSGIAFSQRTVAGWLREEDSVIVCADKDKNFPGMKMEAGLWYRFHGLVSISEAFGNHMRHGQHMITIQPLKSAFDVADSTEEPDGRKDRYKDFPKYIRDSVTQLTLEAPLQSALP